MSHRPIPSLLRQIMEGAKPSLPHSLAILLMVAGAIGFAVSLVAFDGQLLCLFGSTVVVFTGLIFSVLARRLHSDAGGAVSDTDLLPTRSGQVAQSGSRLPQQAPAPQSWKQPESSPGVPPEASRQQFSSSGQKNIGPQRDVTVLVGQVSEVLRRQGAQVWLDAQREDRSILRVRTRAGDVFTAIVLAGSGIVDVSEVRGLYGLMTANGSVGAFMVTGGTYSVQAQNWARQRSLTLLEARQVGEIRVD